MSDANPPDARPQQDQKPEPAAPFWAWQNARAAWVASACALAALAAPPNTRLVSGGAVLGYLAVLFAIVCWSLSLLIPKTAHMYRSYSGSSFAVGLLYGCLVAANGICALCAALFALVLYFGG